jgi:trans-aconitate methyltransferase
VSGTRYSPAWLDLREPADAAARAAELVEPLPRLPRYTIHDLGCGTGSMARWLAPRLRGAQSWILYDQDPELLVHAAARMPDAVAVQTRQRDITRLTARDLAGASLVTASALLDLLTAQEVTRLARVCAEGRSPALFTLSVRGQARLTPADPLDAEITAAFNAHQRRSTGGRRLLGPDAVPAAAQAFARLGASVTVRPSPWRLGPDQHALIAEWLRGWVGAAVAQRPGLGGADLSRYLARRRDALAAGELRVVVQHSDLLASYE